MECGRQDGRGLGRVTTISAARPSRRDFPSVAAGSAGAAAKFVSDAMIGIGEA
jgi:hypothetical protein